MKFLWKHWLYVSLRRAGQAGGIGLLLAGMVTAAHAQTLGPLIAVSGSSPFLGSTLDNPGGQTGTNYGNSEVETWLTVNPTNRNNIVAIWQQDRWSNGGCRGFVAEVSFDGGTTWQPVPIPGFSKTTGGNYTRISDPWASFAPNGDLYVCGLEIDPSVTGVGVIVNKSVNGGLTWQGAISINDDTGTGLFDDKCAVTADPTDARYAYVVWDRISGGQQPTLFSRTTNGGQKWSAPVTIGGNRSTLGNQIVVRPDGTLINFYTGVSGSGSLNIVYSKDKGVTWLPAGSQIKIADFRSIATTDPDTSQGIRAADSLGAIAVDPHNGNLYVVWEDARFSSSAYNEIAFSQSTDGGLTWSAPIKINKTPTVATTKNRQAWNPAVHVADDGTISVSYYDFRNNTTAAGALTDGWIVRCTPTPAAPATNAANWGNELRLTDTSFDIKKAPNAGGYFLGDYEGIAHSGNDFLALVVQTSATDPASVFIRRVSAQPPVAISGQVALEECASPGGQSIAFQFRPTDGTAPFLFRAALDASGAYSLPNVPAGQYNIAVKGAKWLQEVYAVTATSNVSGLNPALRGGDANNDNTVDIADFGILVNSYGGNAVLSGSGYDVRADFTCDGVIDVADFGVLVNNYGSSGTP